MCRYGRGGAGRCRRHPEGATVKGVSRHRSGPVLMSVVRGLGRAWDRLCGRTVHSPAEEVGVRQFIDIGSGLPTMENTHEVAQRVAPAARVVYVDNDPVVSAHGQALLATGGNTRVIQADLRRPQEILDHPGLDLIDPFEPVAILLVAVLHFLAEEDDPYAVVAHLRDAVAPGSHLVVSHLSGDRDPVKAGEAVGIWERAKAPVVPTMRSKDQVRGGFALVEPGVVPINRWRPDDDGPVDERFWLYGGVGRR
jgi:SAM-dependent methyltransferase